MPTENGQQQAEQQPNDQQQNAGGETPQTWEAWLGTQPEDVKSMYESHTSGLKNALDNERASRKSLESQLREFQKKADKGSELEQQLNRMVTDLETANRRSDFVEAAIKPEIGVSDLKAAWLIVNADADTYIDKRGQVNFPLLKQNHPGLFKAAPAPKANAGNGAGQGEGKLDMNTFIRRAAGRQ